MLVSRYIILLTVFVGLTQVHATDPISILQNIKIILDGATKAKDVWNHVKDFPPTLIDYVNRLLYPGNDQAMKNERSAYDFVIDLTRLSDIFTQLKAYPLAFPQGKDVYDRKIRDKQISRFIVNVVGRYNTGKTFLLRMLANINLDHGFTERTNGLSVALPELRDANDTPMALIDTAGTRTPVEYRDESFKDRSYERQMSDSFIQEVAISSSEIFVCVVNQLTLDDQLYLKTLYNRLLENNLTPKDIKQRLLLVHNYFNLRTVQEVQATEKYELETLFGAVKQPQGYWLSKNFKHFVIANSESEGGKKYNERAIEQLRAMIRGANADANNDVLGTIIDKIELLLSKVLVEQPSGAETEESEASRSKYLGWFQRVKAYITSSSYKPIALTPEKPVTVKLTVESLRMDKGQVLWFVCPSTPLASNISISRNLKFAPDGSVQVDYSSQFIPGLRVVQVNNGDIQIAVECPSCEKSYTISTRGQSVIIRGDKIETKTNMRHEYLNSNRIGQFEVEVPIGRLEKEFVYDVRKGIIKTEYQNGVITVTVPRLADDEEF